MPGELDPREFGMIKIKLKQKMFCKSIEFFSEEVHNTNYVNYVFMSNDPEGTIVNMNCVSQNKKVNINDTIKEIVIYDERPTDFPWILSKEVRLVHVSDRMIRFKGSTAEMPYSEVVIDSGEFILDNAGELIGKKFYIGLN